MESRRDKESSAVNYWKSIIAAIPQAAVTTISTQPLRNAQLLQQTTTQVGGMTTLVALKTLGLKDAYKSIVPSTMKLSLQHAFFNPAFLLVDRALTPQFKRDNPLASASYQSLLVTLYKAAFHPFDMISTQVISGNKKTAEVFKQMVHEFHSKPSFVDKVNVGYRGVMPEALKQVIGNGCLFLIKDQLDQIKELCGIEKTIDQRLSYLDTVFVGLFSSAIKNAITQPFDTVSKVMQANPAITTIGGAVTELQKRALEADRSLASVAYRGFVPKTVTGAVVAAATVAMLEYCKEPSQVR